MAKYQETWGIFTSLRSIDLSGCGLSGEFPDSVFELPRLEFLDLTHNDGLTGRLTGFHGGSLIKYLKLSGMNLTGDIWIPLGNLSLLTELYLSSSGYRGEISSSIGNLTKLEFLDLGSNDFHGPIPSSLGNLTSLTELDLSGNRLSGGIPSSLGNLITLNQLDLSSNQLVGGIPSPLMQLSQLSELYLYDNMLTGTVPSGISNLTRLNDLDLSSNKFDGPLPHSIYGLRNLVGLGLGSNYLTGVARLDLLLKPHVDLWVYIELSSNAFSTTIFPEPHANISQIRELLLDSCNIAEVPKFLKDQHELGTLSLSHNNISGQIPKWLWQITTLWKLDLSFNFIRGTLSIPPNTLYFYLISNNKLSGEIPSSICELENIEVLDLAENDFSGALPSCLVNLSSSLAALNLRGNHIRGKIPEFNHELCFLSTIDMSSNLFEGLLPRSLLNCSGLKYVNFGRNKIRDTFPSWLGPLPLLKVLMLHSNEFYGEMKGPQNHSWFPSLKIIYMSMNNMKGPLPNNYFTHLSAMKNPAPDDKEYMRDNMLNRLTWKIIDKGIEREFGKTLGSFTLLDLSSNNFNGIIPNSIGVNLLKLHTLNLSNNHLKGPIPQSLANLKDLEVLDLSRNRLSGVIPGILLQVTSLEVFNVYYNNLSGSIPMGNQFSTFKNDSYIGNPGLCGGPLTNKCGNLPQSPPSGVHSQEEKSSQQLGMVWITALVGLAGGLVVGVVLENAFGVHVKCWMERKWWKYQTSTA